LRNPPAHRVEAHAALLACGGMHDHRLPAGGSLCRGYRRVQIAYDLDQFEGFEAARIEAAAVTDTPVVDHRARELALLGHRMDDIKSAHAIGARGARDVVQIQRSNGRRYDAAVAVDHRVMHEGDEDVGLGWVHGQSETAAP